MNDLRVITLSEDTLLDLLTSAATIGRNELYHSTVTTRGDIANAVRSRMRDRINGLGRHHPGPASVWVVVVDNASAKELNVGVFRTEAEAFDMLRGNYADNSGVHNSELIDYVVSQGCEVHFEEHLLS